MYVSWFEDDGVIWLFFVFLLVFELLFCVIYIIWVVWLCDGWLFGIGVDWCCLLRWFCVVSGVVNNLWFV